MKLVVVIQKKNDVDDRNIDISEAVASDSNSVSHFNSENIEKNRVKNQSLKWFVEKIYFSVL